MVIYLYGPDFYRRREKLKEYIERYKAKYNGLSLSNFYLDQEADWEKLKDFSQAQSLFENVRLGIVFGIENLEEKSQKEFAKLLTDNLKVKDLNLTIIGNKKPVKEFNFLLKEPVVAHEFENLSGGELHDFFQKETKKRSLFLDKESENLLSQVYNGDSWGLITELDKLALLNEKKITKKVLENHLHVSLSINIFESINQMRYSKNISSRLTILENLFARSKDPAMIFNIMAVSPYAERDWKQKVADYDAAIKSGKLEYEEALTDLVISD